MNTTSDPFDPATDFIVPPLRTATRAAPTATAPPSGGGTPTPGTAEFERLSEEIHDLLATIVRDRDRATPGAVGRRLGKGTAARG